MSIQTVGILSPGDMGHAIGAVLHQHQMRVITNLHGRSARTVGLAKTAGFSDVSDRCPATPLPGPNDSHEYRQ